MIASMSKSIEIRVPLIPGLNDSEENIQALSAFMKELGLRRIHLLPYHNYGMTKYERLGMEYELRELQPLETKDVERIKAELEANNFEVGIG
jgi:pyruvate formate lyase activating enzyme